MSGSAAVHLEIPGFVALSEHGHWDACAVIAELAALHVCAGNTSTLSAESIVSFRNQYLATPGKWTPGQGTTLANIRWHLTTWRNAEMRIAAYLPYSDTPNLDALHTLLKTQLVAGNPVILQVTRAYNLPHNERGVEVHFVTLGGIDSTAGYLVANGDTTDALASSELLVPTYWATWAQLVAAGLCGAIALDASYKPATPPPPVQTPPTSSDPHALAAEALSALQRLIASLS